MSQMVLMKMDGTYEEMEMTTDKLIYFQSRGYKVYTWEEMFKNTLESTTEKIKEIEQDRDNALAHATKCICERDELEGKLMQMTGKAFGEAHKVDCNGAIIDDQKQLIEHWHGKFKEACQHIKDQAHEHGEMVKKLNDEISSLRAKVYNQI